MSRSQTSVLNTNCVSVCIEDLLVSAFLGAHAHEQKKRRRIAVRLEFEYPQPSADSLAMAIDYRGVRDAVFAVVEKQRFFLVESMARAILDAVRSEPRVSRVFVKVSKPGALKQAKAVTAAVEWIRPEPDRLL
jgi:dihydroneopterin aldolase